MQKQLFISNYALVQSEIAVNVAKLLENRFCCGEEMYDAVCVVIQQQAKGRSNEPSDAITPKRVVGYYKD